MQSWEVDLFSASNTLHDGFVRERSIQVTGYETNTSNCTKNNPSIILQRDRTRKAHRFTLLIGIVNTRRNELGALGRNARRGSYTVTRRERQRTVLTNP